MQDCARSSAHRMRDTFQPCKQMFGATILRIAKVDAIRAVPSANSKLTLF